MVRNRPIEPYFIAQVELVLHCYNRHQFLHILLRAKLGISMTYDEFNSFCASLAATTHVIQWGNSHVWKVGSKVFAIGGWEKESAEPAFTFKTSEQNFHFLSEHPNYRPAPYLAARGMSWIQQYRCSPAELDELKYYISESHRIVSLGLSKKKQKELGLNQS